MKRNQISFFATPVDLKSLLNVIESKKEIRFIKAGLFDAPALESIDSLANLNNLGIATSGDASSEACYLAAGRNLTIAIRNVPQHGGGIKYAVDQLINPKTITFRPGGLFENNYLIGGDVGTVSNDLASSELYSLFKHEVYRLFRKIKSYYVSEGAIHLLNKGHRLTTCVKSPVLYDLKN